MERVYYTTVILFGAFANNTTSTLQQMFNDQDNDKTNMMHHAYISASQVHNVLVQQMFNDHDLRYIYIFYFFHKLNFFF